MVNLSQDITTLIKYSYDGIRYIKEWDSISIQISTSNSKTSDRETKPAKSFYVTESERQK